MEGKKLITLTEAADNVGVSTGVLRRAIRLGNLHAEKYGKTWLTTQDAINLWIKEHHNPNMRRR